jgi:hypothetical protein
VEAGATTRDGGGERARAAAGKGEALSFGEARRASIRFAREVAGVGRWEGW